MTSVVSIHFCPFLHKLVSKFKSKQHVNFATAFILMKEVYNSEWSGSVDYII